MNVNFVLHVYLYSYPRDTSVKTPMTKWAVAKVSYPSRIPANIQIYKVSCFTNFS